MMSARYAGWLLVLLLLALVPTVIHSYAEVTVEDGKSAAQIPATLAGYASQPGPRNAGWGRRRFDTDDWIAREYVSGTTRVILTAVRAYDLKALYHHPELAVAYDTPFFEYHVRSFPGHPSVPVHVLRDGTRALGLYVLLYDGEYVSDPVWFQLRTSARLLVSGRRPMTLLFARQTMLPPGQDIDKSAAAAIRRRCNPPEPSDYVTSRLRGSVAGSGSPSWPPSPPP
jgi:hypothetical protein